MVRVVLGVELVRPEVILAVVLVSQLVPSPSLGSPGADRAPIACEETPTFGGGIGVAVLVARAISCGPGMDFVADVAAQGGAMSDNARVCDATADELVDAQDVAFLVTRSFCHLTPAVMPLGDSQRVHLRPDPADERQRDGAFRVRIDPRPATHSNTAANTASNVTVTGTGPFTAAAVNNAQRSTLQQTAAHAAVDVVATKVVPVVDHVDHETTPEIWFGEVRLRRTTRSGPGSVSAAPAMRARLVIARQRNGELELLPRIPARLRSSESRPNETVGGGENPIVPLVSSPTPLRVLSPPSNDAVGAEIWAPFDEQPRRYRARFFPGEGGDENLHRRMTLRFAAGGGAASVDPWSTSAQLSGKFEETLATVNDAVTVRGRFWLRRQSSGRPAVSPQQRRGTAARTAP